MLRLFNTLSRKIEDFIPLNPPMVTIYTCGPTVYNYQHIGNFRTMIFSDLLIRVLSKNDFQVKSVRNITDIDDKIVRDSKANGLSIEEFTKKYEDAFYNDLAQLNVLPVNVTPHATEHVGAMIKYIEELIKKEFAYVENDGSVYFDISKFEGYGKLSNIEKKSLKTGTRILSDEYTKDNVQDFALWKAVDVGELGGYDSPWSIGRPGWHIECSVMSQEYLGDTLDLHTGAVDLLFPHHENEIAQSEAKTDKPFVRYFVHGEFVLVDGQKMSKSLRNVYLLQDIEEKGFEPLALRYLFLTAHYRDKINFTWESLKAAQHALDNLRYEIRAWEQPKGDLGMFWQQFIEAANNDLGIPQAVAVMWKMIASDTPTSSKSRDLLEMDKILGLGLDQYIATPLEIPQEVQELISHRESARQAKDFKRSDELRSEIKKLGYEIEDQGTGYKIKKA